MLGQIEGGAPSPGNPTDHALVPSKAACNVVRMSTCRWPGPAQRRACESTRRGKRPARAVRVIRLDLDACLSARRRFGARLTAPTSLMGTETGSQDDPLPDDLDANGT